MRAWFAGIFIFALGLTPLTWSQPVLAQELTSLVQASIQDLNSVSGMASHWQKQYLENRANLDLKGLRSALLKSDCLIGRAEARVDMAKAVLDGARKQRNEIRSLCYRRLDQAAPPPMECQDVMNGVLDGRVKQTQKLVDQLSDLLEQISRASRPLRSIYLTATQQGLPFYNVERDATLIGRYQVLGVDIPSESRRVNGTYINGFLVGFAEFNDNIIEMLAKGALTAAQSATSLLENGVLPRRCEDY